MTLLPISAPIPAPNGVGADEATTTSGDFAALLALVGATAPAPGPMSEPASPEGTVPERLAPAEPQPDPAAPGRDPGERPAVRVPACPVAVEHSPVLVEAPVDSTIEAHETPRAVDRPLAEVVRPTPGLAARPLAEDSPPVSENFVAERRVPAKPFPRIDAPAPTPLPAAVVRAEASRPVDTPAPTTVAPPAVPVQIVSAVVPLHGRGDGRHEVTLELRPEDLGTIRVEVSVEHQTVHVTLHAAEPATGRLLSAALADLRSALADAGLRAGDVFVSPDGDGAAGRRQASPGSGETSDRRASARGGTSDDSRSDPVRIVRPATAGRLDLFL
jgi:flagellar hook-length control protein FliK